MSIQRIGGRKFALGMVYTLGALALIAMAITYQPQIVAEVGIACVSLAPGIGVIVWGNVQEHRATNGS